MGDASARAERGGDKRAKFDALPSPEVSSKEVGGIPKGDGFRQRVTDWIRQKDIFGEYTNSDTNWGITFNATSVRNTLWHSAYDGKIALLEHAPDLIENGVFLETVKKKDSLDSHIFAAKATIDGDGYIVGFVVRDDANGKRYYDHEIRIGTDNKNQAESDGHRQGFAKAKPQTGRTLPEDDNTVMGIVQKHLKAKKDGG